MAFESNPIALKLNEYISSHNAYMWLMWFDEMNPAEKALVGTWELVNEVYNGGFIQYFHNSSREHAKPMLRVLRSIEAHRTSAILKEAIALAGPGTPSGDAVNFPAAIKAMPKDARSRLKQLERDLYDELDNLHRQVFRYLSKHRDKLNAPGDFWTEPSVQ